MDFYTIFVQIWLCDSSCSTYDSWTSTHYIFSFYFDNYIITSTTDVARHMDTHCDGTGTNNNLILMIWTSWWSGNAKSSPLLLHFEFLMVDLIYASFSWKIHFYSYHHPPKVLWSIYESFKSSSNVFFVSIHDLLHVSVISLFFYSSPQVFLYI